MKRNAEMNRLLSTDKEHFICCEKYTMKNGFYDIESNCLGAYLGGYAGQYGIRFDICGWMEEQDKLDENGNAIKDPSDDPRLLMAISVATGLGSITLRISTSICSVRFWMVQSVFLPVRRS